jgi:hypothetical protein
MERQLVETQTLCALVHGGPGVGKSWLGQSTPSPRLVLDAEGGSRSPKRMVDGTVVRQRKVTWDVSRDDPPVDDGTWDTCVVVTRDFNTVQRVFEWLNSGSHPFRSVIMDSLTEIQKRCKDSISGTETPNERDWGLLLIRMEYLVRQFRDLVFHPVKPLEAVLFLALTKEHAGVLKPAIQGGLGVSLPGYMDVEGYLFVEINEQAQETRRLLVVPRPGFEAKDRTHDLSAHFGPTIDSPDVERMLAVLNSEEQ